MLEKVKTCPYCSVDKIDYAQIFNPNLSQALQEWRVWVEKLGQTKEEDCPLAERVERNISEDLRDKIRRSGRRCNINTSGIALEDVEKLEYMFDSRELGPFKSHDKPSDDLYKLILRGLLRHALADYNATKKVMKMLQSEEYTNKSDPYFNPRLMLIKHLEKAHENASNEGIKSSSNKAKWQW